MKNQKYSQMLRRHVPDQSQKNAMWERLSDSYDRLARQDERPQSPAQMRKGKPMTNEYTIKKRKKNVLPRWTAAVAAGLVFITAALLLLQMFSGGKMMIPRGRSADPESSPRLPAGQNGGVPASQEPTSTFDPDPTEENKNLKTLTVHGNSANQTWYTTYGADPVVMTNPYSEETKLPRVLPVLELRNLYGLSREAGKTMLKDSLKRVENGLALKLNWDALSEVSNDMLPMEQVSLWIPTVDNKRVIMATLSPFYGVDIYFLQYFPEEMKESWPVGHFYNPLAENPEKARVLSVSPESLEAMREINKDPVKARALFDQFVLDSLVEAERVTEEWMPLLPWKSRQNVTGKIMRGALGTESERFSFWVTNSAPLVVGDKDFTRTEFEPDDVYAAQVFNSGYRKVSWITASQISTGFNTINTWNNDGIPLTDELSGIYAPLTALGDSMSVSSSQVIGFGIPDYAAYSEYLGQYPLRSEEEALNLLSKLMEAPLKEGYEILGRGMSYQRVYGEYESAKYLIPCYDFVLEGDSNEPAISDRVRVEISIPAVKAEFLEYIRTNEDGTADIANEEGEVIGTVVYQAELPTNTAEFSDETVVTAYTEIPTHSEIPTESDGEISFDPTVPEQNDYQGEMKIEAFCSQDGHVSVTFFNNTNRTIHMGREFLIETMADDLWFEVPLEFAFTEELIVVLPGESYTSENFVSIDAYAAENNAFRVSKNAYEEGEDGSIAEYTLNCMLEFLP